MSYPRLGLAERRKLASSARAKAAGRNAALRVGVMGGAGPGQGTATTQAQYDHEISAEDRAVIDRVIADHQSQDAIKRVNAYEAWSNALYKAAPALGPLMLSAAVASFVLDFMGRRIMQPFTLTGGGKELGYCDTGFWSSAVGGFDVSAPFELNGQTCVTLRITAAHGLYNWTCDAPVYDSNHDLYRKRYNFPTTVYNLVTSGGQFPTFVSEDPPNGNIGFASLWDVIADGPNDNNCLHPSARKAMPYERHQTFKEGNFGYALTVVHAAGTCYKTAYICDGVQQYGTQVVCPDASAQALPPGTFEAPSYVDPGDEPDPGAKEVPIPKDVIKEILRILCEEHGYCPEDPCEPTGGGGGGGYDPPGWNPPEPGGPPGGGYDPGEGPEFGGYDDPGPADGYGTFDPGRETCITFRDPPQGFNDPTQPGGIARRYQPGQRATVRSGGTPREADAVERVDTTTTCWDALVAAGWRGRAGDAVERLYPPYDFIRRKSASDVLWNCLILLGWATREADEDVEVVAERALYRPGAPDVYTGKIKRVKRLESGGVRICFNSPLEDRPAPEKICFRGKVIDAIASVLSQMGVEDVIFDSDCTEVIFPRVCFPPGTPLRHILNYLLDLCGFCTFPQFDGKVIVGHCEPLNVHWHYHEDVDLIGFDLEYDNTEIPAIVEVFRPDKVNRAGRVTEAGYAYPYPVQSPFGSGDDVLRIEVPYGTTNAQVRSIAHSKARGLGRKAMPLTSFAVPLNSRIKLRHQIHIRRPSLGFTGIYMITRLARDYAEEADLNLGMGRWLRGDGG
jgi:hypothetical protein